MVLAKFYFAQYAIEVKDEMDANRIRKPYKCLFL